MLSLTKKERLNHQIEIEDLFTNGEKFFIFPFKMLIKPNLLSYNRIVISVTKRNFKKAVHRNLIKRRIKEAYRLNKSILNEKSICHDIFFIYVHKEIADYATIESCLKKSLLKINELNSEKSEETINQ